jgi:hypothetical protein
MHRSFISFTAARAVHRLIAVPRRVAQMPSSIETRRTPSRIDHRRVASNASIHRISNRTLPAIAIFSNPHANQSLLPHRYESEGYDEEGVSDEDEEGDEEAEEENGEQPEAAASKDDDAPRE